MKIADYLEKHSLSQSAFAGQMGVSPGMVYQWLTGRRPISPTRCVVIENRTCGEISRRELRPSDWQEIWPDLSASQPEAIQ